MARLFVTVLLIFFVFAFSHARDLTDRSENEVSIRDSKSAVLESDSKASIFLPSEKPIEESESQATGFEWKDETTESNPLEISETVATETTETEARPVIQIIFRPIKHQFPRRSIPLMFRRGRHGCRHRNHRGDRFKPWRRIDRVGEVSYGNDMLVSNDHSSFNPDANLESDREAPWRRIDRVGEVSYGNDMIVSSEHSTFNPDANLEADRVTPLRWTNFHRVEPSEDSYGSQWKEGEKKLHHHHFHHRHEDEKEIKEEQKHKEKNGFLMSFRKFLKQLEF